MEDKNKKDIEQSKELTCPICLHNWDDPTLLDNCKHIFCFHCIIEWTRLKPECPLCKCSLQTLKHHFSLRNNEKPNWSSSGRIENILELRSEYETHQILKQTMYPADVEKHSVIQIVKSMLGELHSLRSLSITSYSSENIYRKAISEIDQELNEYKLLISKFNKGATRAELFNEPSFRRLIYRKNLMPRSICPPMFNIAFNSEYIRNHREAVKAQLLPYVIRELSALTRREAIDIGTYMDKLLDYFSTNKIKRQDIVMFLNKRGIENPHQFLNNLFHFASTGQTLKVYDQNSEYTPRSGSYTGNFFPEDDEDILILNSNSDVEVIGEREARGSRTQPLRSNEPSNNTETLFNNSLLFNIMNQNRRNEALNASAGTSANLSSDNRPANVPSNSSTFPFHQIVQNYMRTNQENRQMTENWNNRVFDQSYFYRPPLFSRDSAGIVSASGDFNQNREVTTTMEPSQRRHLIEESAPSPDDSDDVVEVVAEVKKRRRNSPANDKNDDDDDLLMMDESN